MENLDQRSRYANPDRIDLTEAISKYEAISPDCAKCRNGIKRAPWGLLHKCGTLWETLMYGAAGQLIQFCDCKAGVGMTITLRKHWEAEQHTMGKDWMEQTQLIVLSRLGAELPTDHKPEGDY